MSTKAQIRFATRQEGQSFNQHPSAIHAQFYNHFDGYPEGLGVEIAESLLNKGITLDIGVTIGVDGLKIDSWEIEHVQDVHGDLDYIYYIWSNYDKSTWISIFKTNTFNDEKEKCIFVGEPQKLIEKYEYNDR